LQAHFARFGAIKVEIPTTRAGQNRNAVVELASKKQQQRAITEMNGSIFEKHRITVIEAGLAPAKSAPPRHESSMTDADTFLASLEGMTASIPQAARSTATAWDPVPRHGQDKILEEEETWEDQKLPPNAWDPAPRHGQDRILKEEETWEDEKLPPNASIDDHTDSKKSLAINGHTMPQASTPAIREIDPRPPCKSLNRRILLTKLTNHQRRLLPFER
jgi:hypothetical protein